ncbi:MAG: tetraacyldisaccharide 4'-kinase [Pyrinomonadaceae bacterium]
MKSILLTPFSLLYSAIIRARLKLYERRFFKSYNLGVPTISVGNLTVGGTGKTPLVAFIARILAERGEKVCVLTRGYRRENERERVVVSDGEKILADVKKAGDEPFELAEKLLGKAVVVSDANRAEAGLWAREKFGITVFILDDAFQHLKVKRQLDIVCVDATNPFGNGKILPRGILREPLKNLKRADSIVITRTNLVENISELKVQISKLNPRGKIFVSENKLSAKCKVQNAKLIAAFCGLGNPENFFAQLRQAGFNLIFTKTFPDHYFYTQKDVDELQRQAKTNGAECFVTTAKDAVKLRNLNFKIPLLIAENELIFDDETAFREMVFNVSSGQQRI